MIVSSSAFVDAAAITSEGLGYNATIVWVPHPIQDRSDEELRVLADKAFKDIVRAMTGSNEP